MVAKLYLFLLLIVFCCFSCRPSSPNSVDQTNTRVRNQPQQNANEIESQTAPQNATQALSRDAPGPIRTYSIKEHPYYAPFILRALSNLVDHHGESKRNHFYISKVNEYAGGWEQVWIYWKERRILMTWDQNTGTNSKGEYAPEFDLVSWWPKHVYRLNRDLVRGPYANGNDRLTVGEAGDIIRECKQGGDLFLIKVP